MNPVLSRPLVAAFANRFLGSELPGLPEHRRLEVTDFICRRIDDMPSLTRFGVLAVASCYRAALAVPGGATFADRAARVPAPLAGEYIRLLRSLGYAYVWETWPDTLVDGTPARHHADDAA